MSTPSMSSGAAATDWSSSAMPPVDWSLFNSAGRIPKQALLISTAVLYALCIIAAVARFYIRYFVQKKFAADDAFLIIAIGSLTSLLGVMYATSIDNMYLIEFLTYMMPDAPPPLPLDIPQRGNDFQKYVNVILILSWITINAVKLSFLFFFRQLIDRIRPLVIYWRIVLVACVGAMVYGICTFFVACPNNYNYEAAIRCIGGSGRPLMLTHFWASMVVDLLGDFAILFIPIKLVWGLRLKWSKKAVIGATLGLTVFVMIITVIRIATIVHEDKIDPIWGLYWHIIAAEVGIIMAAGVTFRVFFVARNKQGSPHSPRSLHWYHQKRNFFRRHLSSSRWRRHQGAGSRSLEDDSMPCDKCHGRGYCRQGQGFPSVLRAHMTGMRTFIDAQGRTVCTSPVLKSTAEPEEAEAQLPYKPGAVDPYIIRIRRDMLDTQKSADGDDQAASQYSQDDSRAEHMV